MFDYNLALATGVDFPIPELQITIHQPTIREISMIGEATFFYGIQLLCLNKSMYIEDETLLAQTNNFQIFIALLEQIPNGEGKNSVLQVCDLLFPQAKVMFTPRSMLLNFDGGNVIIDEGNFEVLQELLKKMFCLSKTDQDTFNPQNEKAREIAAKLMKARKRVAEIKAKENAGGSMFGQYLSILTVGLGSMSLRDCIDLTMFQLYDLVERYQMYISWDIDIRARMAGAKGDKPVEDWMKPIHNKK